MRCIIAGSRHIIDYEIVVSAIYDSGWRDEIDEVVCGKADGVDSVGAKWANTKGIPIVPFPADWRRYGKAAGPIRNKAMAAYADALILVWDGKSKGSANMLRQAGECGLKIYQHVVTTNDSEGG